ncbi:MAG: alkaline phosphatase family protein [Desulfobacterales bacterium]|nr:MAG: alkaline phosphatase family protein [Desulfobacterales bacterium]
MTTEFGKVFVLGLDGATFDIIDPLIAGGRLPNLESLIQQGCGCQLLSTIHPFSAQAWSSFMTGMNPGKHGIIDFTEHVKSEYRLKFLNASHRRGKSLWRILSDCGKKVGVVNVPFTYPPEEVNGFVISGMDAPSTVDDYMYPKTLSHEIMAEVGNYVIEVGVKDYIAKGRVTDFLAEIQNAFEVQMRTLKYLIENKPWDLFVYVCRLTDQVQHYFWRYSDPHHPFYEEGAAIVLKEAVASLYERIDRAIGSLIKFLGDEVSIIVVSDHGHGGINGKKIFLNKWLSQEGFLRFAERQNGRGSRMFGFVTGERKRDILNFVRRTIPKRLRAGLVKKAPVLKDGFISREAFSNIDWEKTSAYSDEKKGNIWINVTGCQPKGVIAPGEEYEKVREEVIARLREMRDPDSQEPIFPEVFRKEELYWGPYIENAPDIILTEGKRKYTYILQRSKSSEDKTSWIAPLNGYEMDNLPNATHRLEGILMMRGRHLQKRGRVFKPASIIDVAPTILYMMGLPVPQEMDGRVLIDLFQKKYVARHQVERVSSDGGEDKEKREYSPEEEEIISERLRQLGYL